MFGFVRFVAGEGAAISVSVWLISEGKGRIRLRDILWNFTSRAFIFRLRFSTNSAHCHAVRLKCSCKVCWWPKLLSS